MMSHPVPFLSEKKYIKGRSAILAEERLEFLGGERLGDLSIGIESNATCRKIRRIMEKRVAQEFWSQSFSHKQQGNRPRYEMRRHVSNHFRNIFGMVPKGFRYCA